MTRTTHNLFFACNLFATIFETAIPSILLLRLAVKMRQEVEDKAELERQAAEENAAAMAAEAELAEHLEAMALVELESKAAEEHKAVKAAEEAAAVLAATAAVAAAGAGSSAAEEDENDAVAESTEGRDRAFTHTKVKGENVTSGWLTKQPEGGFLSSARRRWFVLTGDVLVYGTCPADAPGSSELKRFRLTGYSLTMHAKKELTFCLTGCDEKKKKKKRKYTLTVDRGKQEEYDTWWAALSSVCVESAGHCVAAK